MINFNIEIFIFYIIMSDQPKLDFVNTIPSLARALLEDKSVPKYTVPQGLGQMLTNQTSATSYSLNQIEYVFNISPRTILDPNMVMEVVYNISMNITNNIGGGTTYSLAGNMVPRAWPLNSCAASTSITLNGSIIGNKLHESDCFQNLLRFNDDKTAYLNDVDYNKIKNISDTQLIQTDTLDKIPTKLIKENMESDTNLKGSIEHLNGFEGYNLVGEYCDLKNNAIFHPICYGYDFSSYIESNVTKKGDFFIYKIKKEIGTVEFHMRKISDIVGTIYKYHIIRNNQ
mgnify:CR=1 FL=1